jgi:hypothetical protein
MKMFLLACIAVAALGVAANLILETQFAASSGERYAIDGSTRLSPQYFGDPRGFLAPQVHQD